VPFPWIAWDAGHPLTIRHLRLIPAQLPVRRPTSVQLSWPGGGTGPLAVGADGTVVLPRSIRARAFRLTILSAAFPPGLTARQRAVRAVGIGEVVVRGLAPLRRGSGGAVRSACGDVQVGVAGRDVPLRVLGTVAELEAGRPLAARACSGPVTVPAGIQYVSVRPGGFSVDLLRLRSPAPAPLAIPAILDGTVNDPGHVGRYSVGGVRLALRRPSWLVLGESYDTGWQVSCDGRSLGRPTVIDGYANGWLAPAGCRRAAFTFAPQQGVNRSYVISAAVAALLAALLLFTRPPRPREEDRLPPLLELRPARPRMSPARAIVIALILTVPLSFIFAWRSALFIAPLLALVFWRGVGARALAATSAALIAIAIPLEYVIAQPNNEGGHGYNFGYSVDVIYAHWIGVVAVILLGLSGWMTLTAAWGRRAGRRPPALGGGRGSAPFEHEDDRAVPRPGQPREKAEPAVAN
jgi:hypothetical protein